MAAMIFVRKILAGEPIPVFNRGDMRRDFTYVDDIKAGVIACLDRPPADAHKTPVYNLGNHRAEALMDYIGEIERALGKKAILDLLPMQPGDVKESFADIEATTKAFGFKPKTTIAEGIPKLVAWYKDYYGA